MERAIDAEMAEHDLTGVQWGPLLIIHFGLGNTAAELARVGCVDTGAMTRMLDRLEAKGLVQRTPCPKDARVVRLELTDEGHRLCREIPFGLSRVLNRCCAALRAGVRDLQIDGPPDAGQCRQFSCDRPPATP